MPHWTTPSMDLCPPKNPLIFRPVWLDQLHGRPTKESWSHLTVRQLSAMVAIPVSRPLQHKHGNWWISVNQHLFVFKINVISLYEHHQSLIIFYKILFFSLFFLNYVNWFKCDPIKKMYHTCGRNCSRFYIIKGNVYSSFKVDCIPLIRNELP